MSDGQIPRDAFTWDHVAGELTMVRLTSQQVMGVLKAAGVAINPVAVEAGIVRVSGAGQHCILVIDVIRTDRA